MQVGLYTSDNGEISTIAQKVKLFIPKIEQYKVEKHICGDTYDFIIGCDENGNPAQLKTIIPTYTDNRELLDSMLNLNFNIVNNAKYSRDRQYDKIIKWCKKYGFPTSKKIPIEWDDEVNKYGYAFNCQMFCTELAEIYNMYMWILACRPELFEVDDYKKDGVDLHRKSVHDTYIRHIKKTHSVSEIQSMLLKQFREIRFKMDVEFENNRYSFIPTFYDLFELAKYQLLLLYNSDNTTGVKECICCGKLFSCVHRNQRYCADCSPQKNYARKTREKRRAELNGNDK